MQGRTYTRQDIVRILDAKIANEVNKMGAGSFWVKVYQDRRDHVLAQYDAGKVVLVEKEWYCENGMEFEREFYSDGSVKIAYYGYND